MNKQWRFFKHIGPSAVLGVGLAVLSAAANAALMFTAGYLIDFSARMPVFAAIYVPVVLTRAFGISRPVLEYAERLVNHNAVLKQTSRMRRQLFDQLAPQAADLFARHQIGEVMAWLVADIGKLQNLYLRVWLPMAEATVMAILVVGLTGWFDWRWAAFLALILAVQAVLLPFWQRRLAKRQLDAVDAALNHAFVKVDDALQGLADWRLAQRPHAFGQQTSAAWQHYAQLHDQQAAKLRRHQWLAGCWFALVPVALLIGSAANWTKTPSAANFVGGAALMMLPLLPMYIGLGEAASMQPTYQKALKRLADLPKVNPNAVPQLPTPQNFDALVIDHVSFNYATGAGVNDLQFTIARGAHWAILGPSGAGKTTLLQLVLGDLTPASGAVRLDDLPVAALQAHRHNLFAVLEQAPYLFAGSLADNLRLAKPDASDAELVAVLAAVGLSDLLQHLPDGINSLAVSRGANFSGGEAQRMALARILLQNPPIIILDEPTRGLDPQTEAALLTTMFDVLADKTLLWVTHHLQGVSRCDHVVFLTHGRVVMQGAPAELLAHNQRYQRLQALDAGIWGEKYEQ